MIIHFIVMLLALIPISYLHADIKTLEGSKPNIIIIMPDELTFSALSLYGASAIETPESDRLFKKGWQMMNFHVSPSCSPSRAALLTGRHEHYSGVTHTIYMRDHINPEIKLIPEMLKECGYVTGIFGKWHLGDEKEYRPFQRGFDEAFHHGGGGIGQKGKHTSDFPGNKYNDPLLLHNEKIIETKGYCTDIFFDQAIDWMKKQDKPFFVYLPPNVMHAPFQAPANVKANSIMEIQNAMLKNLDNNIGKMMRFLESGGLAENTLLIYYGDNGKSDKTQMKMRGGKGRTTEGGIRVPCAFYWKGKTESGRSISELTAHIDLWYTFAELAGYKGELPGNKPWDGRSLLPLFKGQTLDERYFVAHRSRWQNGQADQSQYLEASIQKGKYKLHFETADKFGLYDLEEDLSEHNNLKDKYPAIFNDLKKVFDLYWADARSFMINENVYETVKESRPFWEMYKKKFGEEKFNEIFKRNNLKK